MLDTEMKEQLVSYLRHLRHPIELITHTDETASSAELRLFVDEVANISPLISVRSASSDDQARIPSFSVNRVGELPRVTFAGLPLGHEFSSLVLALLHVSGHPPKISETQVAQVRGLSATLKFETYFSVSCQNCPDVIQSLNLMTALNPAIEHVAIDGAHFKDEVEARQVMVVPTIYLNGELFAQGRMELDQVLEKVDVAAANDRTAALNQRDDFDVLIVGGGPAGAAAAIYAARKGVVTGIVADRFGGQVLDTLAIENFISVSATEGPQLAAALEAHVASYPVDIMKHQRATRLRGGELIEIELESGAKLRSRSVILATGARWRDMNVPGESEYRTRGVTYCPHCDGPLFRGKRVAVVGGGNSGVEAAIDLAGIVAHVTLLEYADRLKADDVLERKLRSFGNVDIVEHASTREVLGDGKKVVGLRYQDRITGTDRTLQVEGIFVQIGLLPNTDWLRGTVELTSNNEIWVSERGQTSVPGVFAAGDVTTAPFKQIIIAAGDGAKAALGAFEHLMRN